MHLLLFLLGCLALPAATAADWVVYYDDAEPAESFFDYDLIVFDSKYHPPIRPLSERGKTVLGYLSVGEVESHRPWFQEVREQGLLIEENPNWPGSHFVDVRDPRWRARVVEELIPQLVDQGFDGVFLDTLDNPLYLEAREPERFAGMTTAAIDLVRTIRRHYPYLEIMVNRAYELLPQVAPDIDRVLGESVYTDYDFDTETYRRVDTELYREQVERLQDLKSKNPDLAIHTLDYWDPDDPEGIARIYAKQRANGFRPYVATLALDRLIPEPDQ